MKRAKLEEAIAEFKKWGVAGPCGFPWRLVAEAAEAHLATLPKTKMVQTWHVEWAAANIPRIDDPYLSREMAERGAEKRRTHGPGKCIRVTGPHQQEVPA